MLQVLGALTAGIVRGVQHDAQVHSARWLIQSGSHPVALASTRRPQEQAESENLVDPEIVRAAQRGDSDAYRSLVEQSQNTIARQMRRFSRDIQVCEELTHDVFVEAFLSLHSFRGDASWIHWLRRVAVRVGYRYWKQNRRKGLAQPLSDEQWRTLRGNGPELSVATDAAELVSLLLEQLAPDDRLVLTMTYLDGCSMSETASRCGWTVTGTKLRAFRARKRLAELIQRGSHE